MALTPAFVRRRRLAATAAVVAGLTTLAGSLVMLHGQLAPPVKPDTSAAVAFDVAPKPKPPKSRPKPKPKPKPKPRPQRAPPPPMLAAGLGGASFGLSGLDGVLDDATDALLGDVGDVVMTEDAVDTAPVPLERVPVQYPPRAAAKRLSGFVTVSMLVTSEGAVDDLRVLEARPPGVFDQAALDAVRQWRFQPATYEGRPVTMRVRQTLRFGLE